ncbi:hypothetical protein INR49_021172 [Caranx melampygus]|nr:hypothetical protein INR49_021172 [Caranx melampygus]
MYTVAVLIRPSSWVIYPHTQGPSGGKPCGAEPSLCCSYIWKRGEGGGEQEREGGEEREGRKENFSLLRSYRGSVCVCACWSGDHAGKTH